ncbi:MAG: nuclear transport factor 2 family protein [bacterium]|nr:nuclear transport factor 2 family protein [bacterium]
MNRVSYLLLFTTICVFTSCTTPTSEKSIITPEDNAFLMDLKEVQWPKAYAEQDTLLLDKILGDDFQMIDQGGNWYTKKDELNWIKGNATDNDSFRYEIKRFDLLENGTAIICGTGHILKDSVKSIYQSSNVLIKRDGKWEAVLSHVSGYKVLED